MSAAPEPVLGSAGPDAVDARWARPATLADVPAIRQFVADACGRLGVAEDPRSRLLLAVTELCANVLRHGYDGGGPLDVRVRRTGPGVSLTLGDEARAFDPTTVRPVPAGGPLEEREPGGLGLLLVWRVVDRFEHARVAGGNEVVVTIEDAGFRTPP